MRIANAMSTTGAAGFSPIHAGSGLPGALQTYQYVSRLLVTRPGDGSVEPMVRLYRIKLACCGAQVLSAGMEIDETVRDPDTTVCAIFYRVRLVYRATAPVARTEMD